MAPEFKVLVSIIFLRLPRQGAYLGSDWFSYIFSHNQCHGPHGYWAPPLSLLVLLQIIMHSYKLESALMWVKQKNPALMLKTIFLWFKDWAGKFSSPGLSHRPKKGHRIRPTRRKKIRYNVRFHSFLCLCSGFPQKIATMRPTTQIKAGADFEFLMRALK